MNCGGSAAGKSRDGQRKLDGPGIWHFRLVIEASGCAPACVAVAGLSPTIVSPDRQPYRRLGPCLHAPQMTSYISFTPAATLYYNYPYQTPPFRG